MHTHFDILDLFAKYFSFDIIHSETNVDRHSVCNFFTMSYKKNYFLFKKYIFHPNSRYVRTSTGSLIAVGGNQIPKS